MLTYWNEDSVSFQFMGQDNALATEQAFRALIAFSQFQAAVQAIEATRNRSYGVCSLQEYDKAKKRDAS